MEVLTTEEKEMMMTELRRRFLKKTLIFLPPCLFFLGTLIYVNINMNYIRMGLTENERSFFNVAFAFLGMLTARLFVGHYIDFLKEKASNQKKVLFGKVNKMTTHRFFVGKQFARCSEKARGDLNNGDVVEAYCTLRTSLLFKYVKKQE